MIHLHGPFWGALSLMVYYLVTKPLWGSHFHLFPNVGIEALRRKDLGIPGSKEFIKMAFKSRAVGTIPPFRMNLHIHTDLARNNVDTHSVVTRLPAQVSSSEFFLKVPGRNVSADSCKCIHLQPKNIIFLSLHFDFDIYSWAFFIHTEDQLWIPFVSA